MERADILSRLQGQRGETPLAFSGLIHVTVEGLQREGLTFPQVHTSARRMARAAASTFRQTGFPSAVVPLDFCVPAEALGAEIDFRENGFLEFPRPKKPLFSTTKEIPTAVARSKVNAGRIPLVSEAITQLKQEIGSQAVIGAVLPGPFTLLSLLVENGALFLEMKREAQAVHQALDALSMFLSHLGQTYSQAGADFLTIHEMAGSPSFLGPSRFETLVWPALQAMLREAPRPRVLAVCGKVEGIAVLLGQAQAEALSVDQSNDLNQLRAALPDSLLFGNLDPVDILSRGSPEQVRRATRAALAKGADAIWPGCDLYPATPLENLRVVLAECQQFHH